MRSTSVPRVLALAALLVGAPALACVDLFHSTNFETTCDVDAAACAVDAALAVPDGGPTNFCAWSSGAAQTNARVACAWLGACEGPVGDNAFGPCVIDAMLAYDCAANPNRTLVVGSPAHAFWDRLWQATSCADVTAAVFPPNVAPACGASSSAYQSCFPDSGTLLSCGGDDAGTPDTLGFEDCTAFGQVCATTGVVAACAGSAATCTSAGTSCTGTELHDCDPDAGPFDLGVDCASVGAGNCVAGAPSACQATGDAGPRSSALQCVGNTVIGSPSGFYETIDCNALLFGSGGCDSTAAGRPWDVSRACTNGPCLTQDSCEGTKIGSCARGVNVYLDCSSVPGLQTCTTEQLPGDSAPHAVCVPSPP